MLQKQNIPINFSEGMSTKGDQKQMTLGTMYKVINGVYTSPMELKKRNGYKQISLQTIDNKYIQNPTSLSRINTLLNLYNYDRLYSFSEKTERWIDKGHLSNLSVTSNTVSRDNFNKARPSMASNFGISTYTWVDSEGGSKISVKDNTTNVMFLKDVALSTLGFNPKVVANSNTFYFFFTQSGSVKYRTLNSANPTTLTPEITLASNLDPTNPIYDIAVTNNRVYCTYNSTTALNKIRTLSIDEDGIVSAPLDIPNSSPTSTISLYVDSGSKIVISWYSGTSVFAAIVNFSLTGLLSPIINVETLADVQNISVIETTTNNYIIQYTISSATSAKNWFIKQNTFTIGGVIGTPSIFARSVSQATKMVSINSNIYTIVTHQSNLQSTYFVLNKDGQVEAKIASANAGIHVVANAISSVSLLNDSEIIFASQIKSEISSRSSKNRFFSIYGITSTKINFRPTAAYQDAVLGDSLYINGGILRNYDGATISEDGFFLFPEDLTIGANAGTGGSLNNGTRQYVAVYAWYDNKGKLHRSTTSIPLSTVQNQSSVTQTQRIDIPTLRLTYKTDVIIEVYRTENVGTLFYKVTSTDNPLYNVPTSNIVTFIDTMSDANLISKELLYTTGGVLDNDQAPNASIICNWKNRLVLAGLENPQQLAYSKELVEGYPANFSDFLRLNINDNIGAITALATLDEKLIIFKNSSIFGLVGNGPNATGAQNDYGSIDKISADVGCEDFNSIVSTPNGLMFKSKKGIYLLDRALSTTYIGAEVEAYNDLTVNSGSLVATSNQVRFLTSSNIALVYDYYMSKWSVFDNHGGLDAEIINNNYLYLRNDGTLFSETPNAYLDNNEHISLQVDTGWISFAGVQNFQRVYKMMGLGEFKSPHKLKIECAYNFVPAYLHETIIDTNTLINSSTYGSDPTYGSETRFGGSNYLNAYQFRVDMKVQKTQSIRILIKELQNGILGEGLTLSNLSFEVGAKTGLFKPSQSQISGAK